MLNLERSNQSSQILSGMELIHKDMPLTSKVRIAMQNLSLQNADQQLLDFFSIVKKMGEFPITHSLQKFFFAERVFEKVVGFYAIAEKLNLGDPFGNALLKFFSDFSNEEKDIRQVNGLLIQFFDQYSADFSSLASPWVRGFLTEKNEFVRIKDLCDFYFFLYQDERFKQLKKAYEHYVSLDSSLQFYNFLEMNTSSGVFNRIKVIADKFPDFRLNEVFSKGQILSKTWMISELKRLDVVPRRCSLILCGWAGLISRLLFLEGCEYSIDVDIDSSLEPICHEFNIFKFSDNKYRFIHSDIFDLDYQNPESFFPKEFESQFSGFDLVVNTSCEHIDNFSEWYAKIPQGQLIVLQSNDFFDCDEHVNCVNSLKDFEEQAPMSQKLFSGSLELEKYNRFMLIGYK